jgi:quercetin dioxygenase-like cupin family protein
MMWNLQELIQFPDKGLTSRTLHNDENIKLVLLSFSQEHELKSHTAPMPITIQILEGEALITIDAEPMAANSGTLVMVPALVTHSIIAKTRMAMLLTMAKK